MIMLSLIIWSLRLLATVLWAIYGYNLFCGQVQETLDDADEDETERTRSPRENGFSLISDKSHRMRSGVKIEPTKTRTPSKSDAAVGSVSPFPDQDLNGMCRPIGTQVVVDKPAKPLKGNFTDDFVDVINLLLPEHCLRPNPSVQMTTNIESYFVQYLQYLIEIGCGSFGRVVVFRDKYNGNCVVDKISHSSLWPMTQRETSFMAILADHRAFLKPIGCFQSLHQGDDEKCHLLMEFFPGQDLHSLVGSRLLNINEFQKIFQQVGDGLMYMHSRGIIHRDLKPSNILVNDHLECRIIDFGLSEYGPFAVGYAGTREYMSPEVAEHQLAPIAPAYGYQADMYSLGVSALFTGAFLCRINSWLDVFGEDAERYHPLVEAHHDEIPANNADVPFFDLLCRLLEEKPSKRLNAESFCSHEFFAKSFEERRPVVNDYAIKKAREELETKVKQNHYVLTAARRGLAMSAAWMMKNYNSLQINARPQNEDLKASSAAEIMRNLHKPGGASEMGHDNAAYEGSSATEACVNNIETTNCGYDNAAYQSEIDSLKGTYLTLPASSVSLKIPGEEECKADRKFDKKKKWKSFFSVMFNKFRKRRRIYQSLESCSVRRVAIP